MSFHRIGKLWRKTDRLGREYLSGRVKWKGEQFDVQIYENIKRRSEKDADLVVYRQKVDANWQDKPEKVVRQTWNFRAFTERGGYRGVRRRA